MHQQCDPPCHKNGRCWHSRPSIAQPHSQTTPAQPRNEIWYVQLPSTHRHECPWVVYLTKRGVVLFTKAGFGALLSVLEAQWLHLTRSSSVANTVLSLQYTQVTMKALVCNALRLTIWLIIRKICCICTVSMCSNQHVRLSASNTQCHLLRAFIAIKV